MLTLIIVRERAVTLCPTVWSADGLITITSPAAPRSCTPVEKSFFFGMAPFGIRWLPGTTQVAPLSAVKSSRRTKNQR